MEGISELSRQSNINHKEWLYHLYNEYNKLIEEQSIDYSPMSRNRNVKHIWNNERRNPPYIYRQVALNNERLIPPYIHRQVALNNERRIPPYIHRQAGLNNERLIPPYIHRQCTI